MNLNKSQIKMALAQSWGLRLEEMRLGAEQEALRLNGAKQALSKASRNFDSIKAQYKDQLDKEEISQELYDESLKAVERCVDSLFSFRGATEASEIAYNGKVEAFKAALEFLEKEYSSEQQRLQAVLDAIEKEGSEGADESGGVRPKDKAAEDLQKRKRAPRKKKKKNA